MSISEYCLVAEEAAGLDRAEHAAVKLGKKVIDRRGN